MTEPKKPSFKSTTVIPSMGAEATVQSGEEKPASPNQPREIGGPKGPEPTRYGDWEHKGRCIDF